MVDISIIIPFYNVRNYIEACLQSVANQTIRPTEVLLINDGSTDGTRRICETFAKKYPHFKIIDQENKGVSTARNTGLDQAVGDYIVFIDSDDFISKDMLEILYHTAQKRQADMVKCGFYYYHGSDQIKEYDVVQTREITLENKVEMFQAMFEKRIAPYVWNALYKREIFEGLKFKENVIMEDTFILPDILANCTKVVVIPDPLYYYRQRHGSIIHSFSSRHFDILKSMQCMKQTLILHNLYEIFRDEFQVWSGFQLMVLVKHAARYSSFHEFMYYKKMIYENLSKHDFEAIYKAELLHPMPQKSRKTDMSYAKSYKKTLRSFEANSLIFWLKVKYNRWRKQTKKTVAILS